MASADGYVTRPDTNPRHGRSMDEDLAIDVFLRNDPIADGSNGLGVPMRRAGPAAIISE